MFASQWPSNHAVYAEILIVKLPQAEQLVNNCFLLRPTPKLGYVARVFDHTNGIEPCTESIADSKANVVDRVGRIRSLCSSV